MRTQTKIALMLFASSVTIFVLFGLAIYYSVNKYSYNDFYKRLQTRASIAAQYYLHADSLGAQTLKNVKEQHLEKLPREQEYLAEIGPGSVIDSLSKAWQLPVSFFEELSREGRARYKTSETFYTGIKYNTGGKAYFVVVSANNYYSTHHLSFLRNVLLTGILLITLITIGLSIYFSKKIFNPIREITRKVKQISTDNMHMRLQEAPNNNELSELILTFNDLLNRMETAFETQKNFISNASHEFGTPLTAIIGEADVALIRERSPAEYREALQNIICQAERLDKVTRSLLFLAQTGYKGKNIEFKLLRADEIVWEVKQVMDQLIPQNKIVVDLDLLPEDPRKLKIHGSRELLHLAVANILNNACKYSQNKPVVVSIASSAEKVIIVIRDEGIGIPGNELQFIYDPFFRASNTGLFEGYGIGLPLTRNIIRLHKGSLTVASEVNRGTIVTFELPRAILF